MRTQLLLGKIAMTFPDEVCFLWDRNTISLDYIASGEGNAGGIFTFANQLGETATVMYESEMGHLVFNLMTVLKKMSGVNGYTPVTVSGSVSCGDQSANITPFTLKCVNGRTLHSRPHNSERVVYYYDIGDLTGIEILMLEPGTINGASVPSGVIKRNFSYLHGDFSITIVEGGVTRVVNVKESTIGGDNSYDTGCLDSEDGSGLDADSSGGLFRVRYLNTDGCVRNLIGKVTSRKRTVGYTDWRADELVRHTPNGMIATTTDEVTVGFPGILRESYAEDIMFSPVIEYANLAGEWQPCVISSKNLSLPNWDENDIEIVFKTLA